jgi:hypothetical protein
MCVANVTPDSLSSFPRLSSCAYCGMQGYVGNAADAARIRRLTEQREKEKADFDVSARQPLCRVSLPSADTHTC